MFCGEAWGERRKEGSAEADLFIPSLRNIVCAWPRVMPFMYEGGRILSQTKAKIGPPQLSCPTNCEPSLSMYLPSFADKDG